MPLEEKRANKGLCVEEIDGVRFRPDKIAQPVGGGVDKAVADPSVAVFILSFIVT